MKICIYAISKNEEKFVRRFMKSCLDADEVIVCDTGSTDKTVQLLRQSGAEVFNISVKPWRFDVARNTALSLIPSDVDVCISLDLDEELQPGWREVIEREWKNHTTRMRYRFDWSNNLIFYGDKIHSRTGYSWRSMCHEALYPDSRITEYWAETDQLLIVHKPDPTKSRGQYLDLLAADTKLDPYNPRNAFYYARELSFYQHWQAAFDECERYLNLPGATWNHERCYARRVQAKCMENLGPKFDSLRYYRMAIKEAPKVREPYMDMADFFYRNSMWRECLEAVKQTLEITDREWVYTEVHDNWTWKPYDLGAIAAYHLGQRDLALEYGKLALANDPNNPRLQSNLEYYSK